MSILFLDNAQIGQNAQRILRGARSQKATGRLDQITRPYQMIAAEVFVALGKAPWNGKRCNSRSFERKRPMRRQHGCRDPITIDFGRRRSRFVQSQQSVLPCPPIGNIAALGVVIAGLQAGKGIVAGFLGVTSKTER